MRSYKPASKQGKVPDLWTKDACFVVLFLYVCMYVCMYVFMYVCMYTGKSSEADGAKRWGAHSGYAARLAGGQGNRVLFCNWVWFFEEMDVRFFVDVDV